MTVAGYDVAIGRQTRYPYLQPLHRGIHIAHRASARALLAHGRATAPRPAAIPIASLAPRFHRTSESEIRNVARTNPPAEDILGFACRPSRRPDPARRNTASDIDRAIPCPSEPASRVRRAFPKISPPSPVTTAAASSSCAHAAAFRTRAFPTDPRRPVGPSGEYILSMQNSARCVFPVTSISKLRSSRSTSHGATGAPGWGNCRNATSSSYNESFSRLIDARRLRGGSDEQAREQIRQRRVIVPIAQETAQ